MGTVIILGGLALFCLIVLWCLIESYHNEITARREEKTRLVQERDYYASMYRSLQETAGEPCFDCKAFGDEIIALTSQLELAHKKLDVATDDHHTALEALAVAEAKNKELLRGMSKIGAVLDEAKEEVGKFNMGGLR